MGSERITRCNPFAIYYHMELNRPFYEENGKLNEFLKTNQKLKTKSSVAPAGENVVENNMDADPQVDASDRLKSLFDCFVESLVSLLRSAVSIK